MGNSSQVYGRQALVELPVDCKLGLFSLGWLELSGQMAIFNHHAVSFFCYVFFWEGGQLLLLII